MGFYGKLSNIQSVPFQFDKIYPNRKAMDEAALTDNVFVGRYVLIDYNYDKDYNIENIAKQKYGNFKVGYKIIDTEGNITFHTGADINSPSFIVKQIPEDAQQQIDQLDTTSETYEDDYQAILDSIELLNNEIWPDDRILVRWQITYKNILQQVFNPYNVSGAGNLGQQVTSVKQPPEIITPETWRCCGIIENSNINEAAFIKSSEDPYKDNYQKNFEIDQTEYYTVGRGWDATVWQKIGASTVVENEDEQSENENIVRTVRYVKVADLSSITPTFDIVYDAPTETPLVPHYSVDTSTLYYKIHMQPQWGIRIKGGADASKAYTIDKIKYPSDVNGPFIVDSSLDTGTLKSKVLVREGVGEDGEDVYALSQEYIDTDSPNRLNVYDDAQYHSPLAIYFNKAGFDPERDLHPLIEVGDGNEEAIATRNPDTGQWELADSIKLRPSGLSANAYHNMAMTAQGGEYADNSKIPDTYELSIMLPSIGNTISKIWDIIYGPADSLQDLEGRDLWYSKTGEFAHYAEELMNEDGTFTPIKEGLFLRNTDMEWDSFRGIRNINKQGNAFNRVNLGSLAGIINSTHDILGMIIRDYGELSDQDNHEDFKPMYWDPTKIYYFQKDGVYQYFMKHKTYTYTPYTSGQENTQKWKEIQLFNWTSDSKIFREDWREYPESLKPSYESARYKNYIKLLGSDEYIDDAIYWTIRDSTEITVNLEYNKNTYYTWNAINNAYTLDSNEKPNPEQIIPPEESGDYSNIEGYYYTFENFEVVEGNFYIPNRYYLKYTLDEDNVENKEWFFYFCTNATLQSVFNKFGGKNNLKNYCFYNSNDIVKKVITDDSGNVSYRKVYRTGPDGETIPQVVTASFPDENHYKKEGNNLVLLNDNGETIIHGVITTVDWNAKTYQCNLYLATDDEYYTPWEFYQNQTLTYAIPYQLAYEYDLEVVNQITTYQLKENAEPLHLIEYDYTKKYYYFDIGQEKPETILKISKNDLETTKEGWNKLDECRNGMLDLTDDTLQTIITPTTGPCFCTIEMEPVRDYFYVPTMTQPIFYKDNENWYREISPHINPAQVKHQVYDEQGEPLLDGNNQPIFEGDIEFMSLNIEPLTLIYRNGNVVDHRKMWEPGKYYVGDGDNKVLSWTYDPNPTVKYYEKVGSYITSVQNSNLYKVGAEWKEGDEVPNNITIGYRTEVWDAKPLKSFSHNINTLYGMLLKLNQILLVDDPYTRDTNTIQGAINRMNDLINNFIIKTSKFDTVIADGPNGDNRLSAAELNTTILEVTGDYNLTTSIIDGKLKITHKSMSSNRNSPVKYLSFGDNFSILEPKEEDENIGYDAETGYNEYGYDVNGYDKYGHSLSRQKCVYHLPQIDNTTPPTNISDYFVQKVQLLHPNPEESPGNYLLNVDYGNINDLGLDNYVKKTGDTMSGPLATTSSNGFRFIGPNNDNDEITYKSMLLKTDVNSFYITRCKGTTNAFNNDWESEYESDNQHSFQINWTDGYVHTRRVYGAVWNDYAEFRKTVEVQPGYCVKEVGDGSLTLTEKRLERGCEIVSDTYGFAIGETENSKTPIAVTGRVLAYPYETIEEFRNHIGWPVCSGPNGTVSIMTEEEEERYPSRIIGIISEIPNYKEWGTGKVKVNGRIWIRIK